MLNKKLIQCQIFIKNPPARSIYYTAEISSLSKGLKFVLTGNHMNKAKLKMELEAYGRMLRLKWHFRTDEKEFELVISLSQNPLLILETKMQQLEYI